MYPDEIKKILDSVRDGSLSSEDALIRFKDLPYADLGHTRLDHHRAIRKGYPEVIYGAGKTSGQICDIVTAMLAHDNNILITRVAEDVFADVRDLAADARFHETAGIITVKRRDIPVPPTSIAVVTAGTSDMPVAEEAAVTAEFLGNRVDRIFDVGVAGIHRIFDHLDIIRNARVVIVIAGMEGALASVVGGLVDKPIIAVPTSVGYGAAFSGLSALLGMLTSCASGISVVNIDNGFGAAYSASLINKL
ncbi:MAG: nickel pincer cofactor biosynthesis protein LarB [Desulfocapsaceae bacterium]|nr:nickel pincer cofactor biosynthesis protein LarB [Desulfocapsaceae bacterium]